MKAERNFGDDLFHHLMKIRSILSRVVPTLNSSNMLKLFSDQLKLFILENSSGLYPPRRRFRKENWYQLRNWNPMLRFGWTGWKPVINSLKSFICGRKIVYYSERLIDIFEHRGFLREATLFRYQQPSRSFLFAKKFSSTWW